ncbi:hypothetical protein O3M35_002245 [Rhynocoris fuscipes]|uniref:Mitochondrial inner membrane protein Mpv17 n=1 Tax=Rhynocoris fuscipes TaxID=488301 RepID=A0AAW1CRC2_9HEMI
MPRLLSSMLATYKKLLSQHTLKVQSIQTAILMGAGDVIAQSVVERTQKDYDIYRTLRFTLLGSAIGPSLYVWYSLLDRIIGKNLASTVNFSLIKLEKPLIKVAIDQGIFAPIFLALFVSTTSLLEGKGVDDLKNRLKDDYPDILLANYKVWPGVQIVNFSIIPLQFRVLFLQIIALAWNTYLAWRLNLIKPELRSTIESNTNF